MTWNEVVEILSSMFGLVAKHHAANLNEQSLQNKVLGRRHSVKNAKLIRRNIFAQNTEKCN